MTETPPTPPETVDEVRADIARTRGELADTVDALSGKLDVKARANDKVADAKHKVADASSRAKHAAPEPVQRALDRVGDTAGPYRNQILVGVAVAALALVVTRRVRSRR